MNSIVCIHFMESGTPGFNPDKDSPFAYCNSSRLDLDGVAVLDINMTPAWPWYCCDLQAVLSYLQKLYGKNLEKVMVIVENAHFAGMILSMAGINPPNIIDVRWLGRYVFGNRPYEKLSELYTRCGGMPLPPADKAGLETHATSTVRVIRHIAGYLLARIPVQELAVIRQTAAIVWSPIILVDVEAMKQLLQPSLKKQYLYLYSFIEHILNCTDSSGRLHILLDYNKAITGRFASVHGCPIHGIPRQPVTTDPAYPVINAILSAIHALPGYFVAADAKAIEPRLFAFLAGEEQLYADLIAGIDIYTRLAEAVFGNSGIAAGMLRQIGKRTFIAFTYGIGADTLFKGLATKPELKKMVDAKVITLDSCARLLAHLKSSYPKMVRSGQRLEDDLRYVYANGTIASEWFKFNYGNGTLSVTLPSGRIIRYYGFAIDGNGPMTYTAADGKTKTLYSSKLAQNLIQAVARDLLVNALYSVKGGLAYHVHDAVVCCVRDNEVEICKQMLQTAWCTPPDWLPEFRLGVEVKAGRNLAELT